MAPMFARSPSAPAARANRPGRTDGTRIVFETNRDGNYEIYAVACDAEIPVRWTNHVAEDRHPVWSRDGTSMVFESNRNGQRCPSSSIVPAAVHRNLTDNPADDYQAALVAGRFENRVRQRSSRPQKCLHHARYGRSGEAIHRVRRGVFRATWWCPDGRTLAVTDGQHIRLIAADGRESHQITAGPGKDSSPRGRRMESGSHSSRIAAAPWRFTP